MLWNLWPQEETLTQISERYQRNLVLFEVWSKSTRSDFTHGRKEGVSCRKLDHRIVRYCHTHLWLEPMFSTKPAMNHPRVLKPWSLSIINEVTNMFIKKCPRIWGVFPVGIFWTSVCADKLLIFEHFRTFISVVSIWVFTCSKVILQSSHLHNCHTLWQIKAYMWSPKYCHEV